MKQYLGIEFGSTRIKAVAIDETYSPIGTGATPGHPHSKMASGHMIFRCLDGSESSPYVRILD